MPISGMSERPGQWLPPAYWWVANHRHEIVNRLAHLQAGLAQQPRAPDPGASCVRLCPPGKVWSGLVWYGTAPKPGVTARVSACSSTSHPPLRKTWPQIALIRSVTVVCVCACVPVSVLSLSSHPTPPPKAVFATLPTRMRPRLRRLSRHQPDTATTLLDPSRRKLSLVHCRRNRVVLSRLAHTSSSSSPPPLPTRPGSTWRCRPCTSNF